MKDRRRVDIPYYGQRLVPERRQRWFDRRRHRGPTRILYVGIARLIPTLISKFFN